MTTTKLKATPQFKRGDFVRIKEGVHYENMPASRLGHVQGFANGSRHYSDKGVIVTPTDTYHIYMVNGETLTFHEMFLEMAEDESR